MPNTSLPLGLNSGSTGHITHANIIHEEMNRLTRETGRRNVESLLVNGWKIDRSSVASSGIHIERVNMDVYLHIRGLDGRNATHQNFLDWSSTDDGTGISNNFFPYGLVFKSAIHANDSNEQWVISCTSSTSGFMMEKASGGGFLGLSGGYWRTFHWRTDRAWPSFLPPAV